MFCHKVITIVLLFINGGFQVLPKVIIVEILNKKYKFWNQSLSFKESNISSVPG